jgi:hypothetical protein
MVSDDMHSSRGGDGPRSTPADSRAARTPATSSTAQSFGQYSQFMRSAVADEESLQVGESLQALAVQIETLSGLLQQVESEPERLATALIDLVGDLRTHRTLLLGVGVDWHRFFEFDAHFAALNQFRILVTQWAMEAAPPKRSVPSQTDFELAAWRVLGEGSMLLDVYEQSKAGAPGSEEDRTPLSVWSRWRAWWKRQSIRRQVVRKEGSRGRRRTD